MLGECQSCSTRTGWTDRSHRFRNRCTVIVVSIFVMLILHLDEFRRRRILLTPAMFTRQPVTSPRGDEGALVNYRAVICKGSKSFDTVSKEEWLMDCGIWDMEICNVQLRFDDRWGEACATIKELLLCASTLTDCHSSEPESRLSPGRNALGRTPEQLVETKYATNYYFETKVWTVGVTSVQRVHARACSLRRFHHRNLEREP